MIPLRFCFLHGAPARIRALSGRYENNAYVRDQKGDVDTLENNLLRKS